MRVWYKDEWVLKTCGLMQWYGWFEWRGWYLKWEMTWRSVSNWQMTVKWILTISLRIFKMITVHDLLKELNNSSTTIMLFMSLDIIKLSSTCANIDEFVSSHFGTRQSFWNSPVILLYAITFRKSNFKSRSDREKCFIICYSSIFEIISNKLWRIQKLLEMPFNVRLSQSFSIMCFSKPFNFLNIPNQIKTAQNEALNNISWIWIH
jgi:hypothetical protein